MSYIVKPGETLFGLSQRFGVSLQQLQLANCLSNPDLKYGQSLFVPFSPSPTPTATELPTEAPTPIPQPLIIANTSLFNVLRDPSRSNGAIARVHIEFTGGAPPYTFYDEGILQAGNPILALTECDGTLIHTVRVDSADGQSASQTYYISPVTCP